MKQGRTHIPMGKTSGKGTGLTKRDSATATGTSKGGSTLKIRKGEVKRTHGTMAKYR